MEFHSSVRVPVWEIAKVNLKHNARRPVALAAVLCMLIPVLTGTANLDEVSSAVPLEMFVSLVGVILLVPVFGPEQKEEIDDLVSSKYLDPIRVYRIRMLCSLILTALCIILFAAYLDMRNCKTGILSVLGTWADAVFLGNLGLFTCAVCENTVIGYMPPLLYYGLNIGMGPKLGNFWLFSMTAGEYGPKLWLGAAGVLLGMASLWCRKYKRQMR